MGRGLLYDAWEHMSVSLAPGKVIVEDLAFTHWTNNHPSVFDACDLKGERREQRQRRRRPGMPLLPFLCVGEVM